MDTKVICSVLQSPWELLFVIRNELTLQSSNLLRRAFWLQLDLNSLINDDDVLYT